MFALQKAGKMPRSRYNGGNPRNALLSALQSPDFFTLYNLAAY